MSEHTEVLDFITAFRTYGEKAGTTDLFRLGYCYWFAYILKGRFPKAEIMYDQVLNHFTVSISGRQYDISGDVTGLFDAEPWTDFSDELERKRVIKNCIDKTE